MLLKNEFDEYRTNKQPRPLKLDNDVAAITYEHVELDKWRENFIGIKFLHQPSKFLITGAVDDIWVNDNDELIVVDYKPTSKNDEKTALDQEGHKWQMVFSNRRA